MQWERRPPFNPAFRVAKRRQYPKSPGAYISK
ncbi:hypothetical protein KP13_31768 [Klebsiella pneumoniae subsp. pneumoniae Kp13]|nr:hypothetical protein KP13_31768 [Klebsiella pneumoniae subsp. pneumoniae Kp13]